MKLAIIGTRTFLDYQKLKAIVDQVKTPISLIISGGANGADSLANQYAQEHGYSMLIHYPNRTRDGDRCYAVRNQKIVHDCDAMIAFHDGKSPGTRMAIDMAEKAGKKVFVVNYHL